MKLFLRHYHLKYLFAILFFLVLHPAVFSQDTGNLQKTKDTSAPSQKIPVYKDSVKPDSPGKTPVQIDSTKRSTVRKDSSARISVVRDSLRKGLAKKDSAALSAIAKKMTDSLSDSSLLI